MVMAVAFDMSEGCFGDELMSVRTVSNRWSQRGPRKNKIFRIHPPDIILRDLVFDIVWKVNRDVVEA
jgi:hypothetical protein